MLKKKTNQEPNRNQTNETATGWPLRSIRLSLFLFCWAFSFIDSISSLFDGCRLVTGHGRRSWWLPAVNLRVLRPPLGPILSSSSTSWCCFFFYFFLFFYGPFSSNEFGSSCACLLLQKRPCRRTPKSRGPTTTCRWATSASSRSRNSSTSNSK